MADHRRDEVLPEVSGVGTGTNLWLSCTMKASLCGWPEEI